MHAYLVQKCVKHKPTNCHNSPVSSAGKLQYYNILKDNVQVMRELLLQLAVKVLLHVNIT